MKHENQLRRFPYIFLYVNLTTRAKIPPDKQIAFSYVLIKLNKKLIKNIDCDFIFHLGYANNMEYINFYENYFKNYLEAYD